MRQQINLAAHMENNTRKQDGLIALLIIALAGLAWMLRFIQDDAFISFRYAQNLCNGHGLVFNAGEHVEGYTNFLWTLLMAAGMKLGLDPVNFSQLSGICLYPFSLWLVFKIGIQLFGNRKTALCALLLAGTNYTYAAYATGGLETHMQSFLFLLVLFLYLKLRDQPTALPCVTLSLAMGLAFLLRMDSAILIACALPASLYLILRSGTPLREKPRLIVALCLPAALIAGAWLLWKLSFYGHILPNTYAVKNPGMASVLPGLYYLSLFVFSYGLFLLAIPVAILLRKRIKVAPVPWPPILFSCLWVAYIVKVGGGFMEFRFFVAAIPFLALIAAWTLQHAFQRTSVQTGCIVLLAVISIFHSSRTRLYGVETIKGLQAHVVEGKWIAAGKALGKQLKSDPIVRIATTAAGAIPYYSKLTTIDMLGLNDAWVAQNGEPTQDSKRKWLGAKPGHQKKATLDYLLAREVHLLIGHPLIISRNADTKDLSVDDFARGDYLTLNPTPFPEQAKLVGIPVDDESALVAVYLTPHSEIDALIACGEWRALNAP